MERLRVARRPMRMDEAARRWLYKAANKNLWRVCHWYDIDDLIQDGMVCWWKVATRYTEVRDRPHMMRLFQTTFTNHVHALANQRTRQPDVMLWDDITPADDGAEGYSEPALVSDHGEQAAYAVLVACLEAAPEPVRLMLLLLCSEDGCRRLRALYRRRRDGTRETTDERLCRLTGIPLPEPIHQALERYKIGGPMKRYVIPKRKKPPDFRQLLKDHLQG